MSQKRDYYAVLGVPKDASQQQIKKAFRQQALKYHPDRNSDPSAAARFKVVNEAYGVLSDSERRARYDRYGTAGLDDDPRGYRGSAADYQDIFGADLFEQLFGAFFSGNSAGPRHGRDIQITVEVPVETIAVGGEVDVTYRQLSVCAACKGSGCASGTQPQTCRNCNGKGQVRGGGIFGFPQVCPRCKGKGQIITAPCSTCAGEGRAKNPVTLRIPIPLGAENGRQLRVDGEGHQGKRGGEPGDLYVEIRTAAHEVFSRDGADLHCDLDVSFPVMALGGDIDAPTLSESVKIRVPPGSQSGQKLRLKGRGLPSATGGSHGHIFVRLNVITPTSLTSEQRDLLARLDASFAETGQLGGASEARLPWWRRLFG